MAAEIRRLGPALPSVGIEYQQPKPGDKKRIHQLTRIAKPISDRPNRPDRQAPYNAAGVRESGRDLPPTESPDDPPTLVSRIGSSLGDQGGQGDWRSSSPVRSDFEEGEL